MLQGGLVLNVGNQPQLVPSGKWIIYRGSSLYSVITIKIIHINKFVMKNFLAFMIKYSSPVYGHVQLFVLFQTVY